MPAEPDSDGDDFTADFQNFDALRSGSASTPTPAVLVLGGSTFMGRALVEMLIARKCRVCVVNRGRRYWGVGDPSGGHAARVVADRDKASSFSSKLQEATRRLGGCWDLIADFSAYNTKDVEASLSGLDGKFKVYAYISSDSIYEVCAWASDEWSARKVRDQGGMLQVSEATAVRPQSLEKQATLAKDDSYGHGKLEGEEALINGLKACPSTCRAVSLRLPDVIGPYDDTHRLWAYWHWLRAAEVGAKPPQVKSYKPAKRKRGRSDGAGFDNPEEVPSNPPLAVVFSKDVARFITSLLDAPTTPPAASGETSWPSFDAVNLGCSKQVALGELLGLLNVAAGNKRGSLPRIEAVKKPKSYLPSVDRPWPLSYRRANEVYGFEPTTLEDALASCAQFFEDGCRDFPKEAKKAAKKLNENASDEAMRVAGLLEPAADGAASDSS